MNKQVRGCVAVITGASSGIGKETAKALAARGWRVIALGRDAARSASAEAEILAASSGAGVDMIVADLSLLSHAERAARQVSDLTDRVDVLVNNAGGMAKEEVITAEGNEANFSGNHLGPFLLTRRILPLMRRAARSAAPGSVRIINTSSDASEMIPGLDWNDLQSMQQFNAGRSYCRAKLANVLFARALSRRLAEEGIIAHAVHPGTVDSNFFSHADAATQARLKGLSRITPQEGADSLIWLATAEEPGKSSGGYFHKRAPRAANPFADDPANWERLWEASLKLTASQGCRD
jgi:NAD(P)-dependent dehydrogenase (short-subunit alcohol dehydrogenase family)